MKRFYFVFFGLIIFLIFSTPFYFIVKADSEEKALRKEIEKLEQITSELARQRNTLSSEIQYMNTQISLTELKIQQTQTKITTTEKEIESLEEKIGNLDQSINYLAKLLLKRLVVVYKNREISLLQIIFDSKSMSSFINQYKYWKATQEENQRLLIKTQSSKLNLEEQKKLREKKITELEVLQKQLDQQKKDLANLKTAKERLLTETKNSEAIYQLKLNEARARLASFVRFVESQGGASLLTNQTQCDSWGCYYNQRDAQWGNYVINNRYDCYNGACSLAQIGCMVTSVAMIATHYGYRQINPLSIAVNSINFSNPADLRWTIEADGKTINLISLQKPLSPDYLSYGPLVVGVRYGDFGTHFIVVKDYKDGKYIINDPFVPNGKDLNFTDRYSLDSIFQINRVVVN